MKKHQLQLQQQEQEEEHLCIEDEEAETARLQISTTARRGRTSSHIQKTVFNGKTYFPPSQTVQ
jgi:hypothetical protein